MILFDGCSWTWGDELENREKDRFSSLIGKDHVNLSERGKSNDGILRTTIEYCENHHIDIAVIQFSKISRREILKDEKQFERITVQRDTEGCLSYYKYLQDSYDDLANFYKNKFLLEQYFKNKKIKHFFMCVNRARDFVNINKYKSPSSWQKMSKKPIPSLYTLFGGGRRDNTPYFDFPSGHPNKRGHEKIAEFICENIF